MTRNQVPLWLAFALSLLAGDRAVAQPTLVDPNLTVEIVSPQGIRLPTGMRFLGPDDYFVIEKLDGKVKRVQGGTASEVLDLNVANNSERGLLGIELHPDFDQNGYTYLYYSARGVPGDGGNSWTDNRVERYVWNGTALVADPSFQTFSIPFDATQNNGPFHNGGPMHFGPDGKLYLATGDLDRSRIEQNNTAATTSAGAGGIYRFNDDGTLPADNPFASNTDVLLQSLFAYGVRNSFGLAFDPVTGNLWDTENGPQNMDEINLVSSGMNSGWSILMGPESRDPQGQTSADLVDILAQSTYSDPEFSFAQSIAPTSIAFLAGSALGAGYDDAVLVGDNNTGSLYLFRLNGARDGFELSGDLADLVADDAAERMQLIFGSGFVVTTDMQVGPDGALYVLSYVDSRVYRIAVIPEPGTAGALALGLLGLAALRRRAKGRSLSRA
jgi:glucose/arabinose dehydrogenase